MSLKRYFSFAPLSWDERASRPRKIPAPNKSHRLPRLNVEGSLRADVGIVTIETRFPKQSVMVKINKALIKEYLRLVCDGVKGEAAAKRVGLNLDELLGSKTLTEQMRKMLADYTYSPANRQKALRARLNKMLESEDDRTAAKAIELAMKDPELGMLPQTITSPINVTFSPVLTELAESAGLIEQASVSHVEFSPLPEEACPTLDLDDVIAQTEGEEGASE